MAEDVASFLSSTFSLSHEQHSLLQRKLSRKFRLVQLGPHKDLYEVLSAVLLQTTQLALNFAEEWKIQAFSEAHFSPDSLQPPRKKFSPLPDTDLPTLHPLLQSLETKSESLLTSLYSLDFPSLLSQLNVINTESASILKLLMVVTEDKAEIITSRWLEIDFNALIRRLNEDFEVLNTPKRLEMLSNCGITGEKIPFIGDIYNPGFIYDYQEVINCLHSAFDRESPLDQVLAMVSDFFEIRLKVYSLKNNLLSVGSYRKENKMQFLTGHVWLWERKAAALIPTKYLIGLKTPDTSLRKSIFFTSLPFEPPKNDLQETEKLKIIDTCLSLSLDFSRPMLEFISPLLLRYYEQKTHLDLTGMDLSAAKESLRKATTETVKWEDFGPLEKSKLREVMKLLETEEENQVCGKCGERAADVTLNCGEQFCMWCIWEAVPEDILNCKGELKSLLPCPNSPCPGQILLSTLQDLDTVRYSSLLAAAEERSQLRFCPLCKHLQHITCFEKVLCGHWMCKYCLGLSYSTKMQCPIDNRGIYKTDFSAETLNGKCEICTSGYYFKQTCASPCIISHPNGDFTAAHPPFCSRCLYNKLKAGRCCANRRFSKAEYEEYLSKLQIRLDCHDGISGAAELVNQTSCEHVICQKCMMEKDTERCLVCTKPYRFESVLDRPECKVCGLLGAEVGLNCGHMIHKECVERLIAMCLPSNHATCPTCHTYLSPSFLCPLLPAPLSEAFNDAFGYSYTFTCPSPNGETFSMPGFLDWVMCTCHNHYYCGGCLAPYTSHMHFCNVVTHRYQADKMMADGKEVSQCPFCALPREYVDREYEQCEGCQSWVAPCCAAPYEQIAYHGPSYHRPDCPKWQQNSAIPKGFLCCKGAICQPPKSLKRRRLIGPGELVDK